VLDGLAFANGVAVARDGSFVLVAETNRARVSRVFLSGARAGERDVFAGKLPAFPDGVTAAPDGGFWIAGIARVAPIAGRLAPYPRLRTLAAHVAAAVFPLVSKPGAFALKVDAAGKPERALSDPAGARVSSMSCVAQHGDRLFLGNLAGDFVSVVDLAAP